MMAKRKSTIEFPPMELVKFAAPVYLSDETVLIASADHEEGIYKYHLTRNQYALVWHYPSNFDPVRHNILLDSDNNKIYIYAATSGACDCFCEIDMNNSKQAQIHKGTIYGLPEGINHESGGAALLALVNGNIHVIGGYSNCYHSAWHVSHDSIHKFKQYPIADRSHKTSLHGHALIAIEESNELVVMGGNTSMIFGGYLNDIWVCDANKMEWKKKENVSMPNKIFNFGSVDVKNEKYGHCVVIFGGKSNGKSSDEIHILNLQNWQWIKSQSKCPKKGMFHAVLCPNDDVHLFEIDKKGHWKMKLSDIMPAAMSRKKSKHVMPYLSNSADMESSNIDVSIMSNLKASLVQEKKRNRALTRDNVTHQKSVKENEAKMNQFVQDNIKLVAENKELNQKLSALQMENDQMKDRLKETQVKLQTTMKQNDELIQREKERTLRDVSQYKHWKCDNIIGWICFLEAGRFEKYKQVLLENMKKENISGGHLDSLDKHDLHRLGCIDSIISMRGTWTGEKPIM